jgi:hypothetical protein
MTIQKDPEDGKIAFPFISKFTSTNGVFDMWSLLSTYPIHVIVLSMPVSRCF